MQQKNHKITQYNIKILQLKLFLKKIWAYGNILGNNLWPLPPTYRLFLFLLFVSEIDQELFFSHYLPAHNVCINLQFSFPNKCHIWSLLSLFEYRLDAWKGSFHFIFTLTSKFGQKKSFIINKTHSWRRIYYIFPHFITGILKYIFSLTVSLWSIFQTKGKC